MSHAIAKKTLEAARKREPDRYPLPLLERKLASLEEKVERRRGSKKKPARKARKPTAKKKAPPRQRALPAPRIAGLLPAYVPPKPAKKRTAQPRTWRSLPVGLRGAYGHWEDEDETGERSRTEQSWTSARAAQRLRRAGPRKAPLMAQQPLFGGAAAKLTRRQGGLRGRLEKMAAARRAREEDDEGPVPTPARAAPAAAPAPRPAPKGRRRSAPAPAVAPVHYCHSATGYAPLACRASFVGEEPARKKREKWTAQRADVTCPKCRSTFAERDPVDPGLTIGPGNHSIRRRI